MRHIHRERIHQHKKPKPLIPKMLNQLHLIIPIIHKARVEQRRVLRPSNHHIPISHKTAPSPRFLMLVQQTRDLRDHSHMHLHPEVVDVQLEMKGSGGIDVSHLPELFVGADARLDAGLQLDFVARNVAHSSTLRSAPNPHSLMQLLSSWQKVRNCPRSKNTSGRTMATSSRSSSARGTRVNSL